MFYKMSPVHVLQMSPVYVLQNESSPCFTNESSPGFTSPVQSSFYDMPIYSSIWLYDSFVRFLLFTRCEGSLNSLVRCAHSFV